MGRGYRPAFEGAQKIFRDSETGVRIEVITAGEYPGDGLPKAVVFPHPAEPGVAVDVEGVRVIALERASKSTANGAFGAASSKN